jgi:glutamate synthase domain-containing protein 2
MIKISLLQLKMQAIYSNNICVKCFDNVKNFCQFRKELINNQAILYQVFSADEERLTTREENFIDISQSVKIKLEVSENDSYNSNEINFESEATMQDADSSAYQFKIEGSNQNDLGIYSETTY